jgi:hypothetical protein
MSNLLKNLLIALGLAILLFVGYVVFLRDDGAPTPPPGMEAFSAQAQMESQQLLSTLNELKSLDVEGTLFSDPLFLSLRDFRIDLGIEPDGRVNPFAPVE